uniref:uncharacterized protein LOC120337231 isoform X2 n=1 Tax=Styela clava TaxID=7725 RepID=UPI00193A57BD|nr:uncharacterized protein LOC120337231 isoform X2 [Styela clava]
MAMDYKMLIIFPLFFSVVWGGRGTPSQKIKYEGSKDLSSGINVMWKVEEKSIVLKLKYRATGWVGIGFSKSKHPQSMADSDITIGWVTMGNAFVWDAYAKTNGVPDVDKKSEVELISGKEESGYTTIVFRRPIIAMNDDDVTIHKGEIGILWAYGRSDVTGGTLSVVDYHARRGYTTLTLIPTEEIASEPSLPDPAKPESPKDVEDHDDADDDDDKQAHEHDDKDLNHFIYLDADKKLFLRWGVKGQEITFKLKGETLGWMGIGLSPGHGMTNSDLMIVGVNREGKAYAYDCFAPENTTPSVDKTQNVEIIEYDQTDTHTTVTFKRALVTDDESGNDRSIQTKNARYKQNADTYFLWAYGLYDVLGAPGIVNYHFGRRGYLKLNLLHGEGDGVILLLMFNHLFTEAMKPAESPKSPEGVEMEESEVPEGFISVKGYKKLDEAGDVVLQWSTAYTSEAVIFIQLSAPTTGWVGLGFSPGNTMKDADLIVAGIKDGTPYIFDLHATRNTLPLVDANQDVLLFQAVEDGPRTIVMMLKKYKSGDTENDIDIMAGKMNVLWAYGETDVDEKLTRMNYHGRNRGHVEVEFIPNDTSAIPDIEDHDDHDDDDDDKQAHEHDDNELKHFIYLDADEKLFLRWGVKGQEITFKLKGETMGWMGIGLSSGPGMTNSDLMIVGVNREGKAYAYDCFAPENTTPSVDETQNVEILEYDQTDTHTTVTFKRALVTDDESGNDRSIQNADTYFLWAYGLYDVLGAPGIVNYHFGRRGYLKLNLLHGVGEAMKPAESPKSPEGVEMEESEVPEGFISVKGYKKLDEAGDVVLQWSTAYTSEAVIFIQLSAPTTGWVGLGFSPGNTMKDADLIVAGIKDGNPYIFDLHATRNTLPLVDANQDVLLFQAVEDGPRTIVMMLKKYKSGDTENDIDIMAGKMNVLWAYGETDVDEKLTRMNYHGRNRGHVEVEFIPSDTSATPDPAKSETPKDIEDHDDHDDDDDKQAHEHDDKELEHFLYLNADEKLFLRWGVKGQEITFKLKGETMGWMGIGLSSGTGMTNSDLMIVGVDREGKAYAYDCFAPENTTPSVDKTQNVEIIEYDQTDTHTTVTFKRALVTNDESGEDRSIQNADTYFIWAYGLYDVLGAPGIVNYHFGRRGYLRLNLLRGMGGVETGTPRGPEGFISVKGYKKLDEAGDVALQWSTANTSEAVMFTQLSAPTTGWVGLGFSPGNTMKDADLIVAGIKDGTPYIFDLYATRNTLPMMDAKQDVLLFQAVEDGPRTIVMMLKKYKSGDTENDIDIKAGKLNVLWAYGETDVDEKLTRMNYHGRNRGHVEVEFIPSDTSAIPTDVHSPGSPKSPKLETDSPVSVKPPKVPDVTGMSPPSQSGPDMAKSPLSPVTPEDTNNVGSPMSPNTPEDGKSPPSPESPKKPPQKIQPVRRGRILQGGSNNIDKLFDDDKMYKQAVLNVAHKVNLKWAYNMDYIVIQISIPTQGWVGVGFSPGPNMARADIVITGVRRDGVYAVDAFASRNGKPHIDSSQDIKVLRYVETAGVTTVTFARKLDTMDTLDNKIGDIKYVIWAYGRADFAKKPRNFYHGSNRGAKMLTLIDGPGGLAADFEMNPLVLVPGNLR